MPELRLPTTIRWSAIVKVVCLIALLIAANLLARNYMEVLHFPIRPGNEDAVHRTIMVSATLYALLLAVPFVPGAEIGIGLLVMLGPPIALLVYLCTVAGLSLSFILGRLIPLSVLVRLAKDIKLNRTSKLLKTIEPLSKKQRLTYLADKAPKRFLPLLLRYRYLALAVALNIPGNYLIGGGGGIALFAGVSRLYSVPGFLITILLSVAPVPIAVMLFGTDFLSGQN
ncbi:MAG: hypothetical protein OES20_03645 [Gammaproteobacteria bacterium]|nr:hypothetical protein [Gammaproteobacteria bacterium]MDH3858509.1 hypothetical protein [Gammaproteobacteria bacterium]